jgi:transcriptional regulator with XRE-family HTH domain
MVIEIRELLAEGKGVATSTIKNFYQRKTNPRRKTIEAIQEWANKEKKKEMESEVDDDDENDDINISNSIIDNNSNSES